MTTRPVGIVMTPIEAHEAPGVLIHRTIGSERLVLLDPFLLCDQLSVANDGTAAEEIGFPRHPHRGIETLTYVFNGRVRHKDSLGNDEIVGAGEAQFMTAGRGIFHEEMVFADETGHSTLQIWLNLPAEGKMVPAGYAAAHNAEIPTVTTESGATVRVVAGTFGGATGPITQSAVRPTYLDVHLPAGASITIPAPTGETTLAYVYRGVPDFGEGRKVTGAPQLAIFTEGDAVTAHAGDSEARFIFACARPWNEPILQYRSLVMTTVEQMSQALDDLENGTFA